MPEIISEINDHLFIPEWPILHMDNHLLAIYKPAGIPVQGDESGDISLLDIGKLWLKEKFNKPGNVFLGLVHRLDRPVAGVMLFCRTSKAAGRISEQVRSRSIKKTYLAVLEGELEVESGKLFNYIERIPGKSSKIVKSKTKNSSEASLNFSTIGKASGNSLVEIDLETGRHHQIRAQFGHIGHPVRGDLRYGASKPLPERQIALFAKRLEISHPITGDSIIIEAPLPEGWPFEPISKKESGNKLFWNWADVKNRINLELVNHLNPKG